MGTKTEAKIELQNSGYKIEWTNGNTGVLRLNWGLHSTDWVNKEDGNTGCFICCLKWQLEHCSIKDDEHVHYFEEVEFPLEKYTGKASFQPLLVDALKKIFVRVGINDTGFATFLVKHFDVFFNRLEVKLNDLKLNIELVTDIFEQALLLTQSDLLDARKSGIYPEEKEKKNETKEGQ